MSKKCNTCGQSNPDLAHYCAKCGKPLEKVKGAYSKEYVIDYIVVSKWKFENLESDVRKQKSIISRLEKENSELQKKRESTFSYKVRKFFKWIKEDWELIFVFIILPILLFLGSIYLDKWLNTPDVEIVEENSKFGIYNNELDRQMVACEYDSIKHEKSDYKDVYYLYKDGHIGFADKTGLLTQECVLDSIFDNGFYLLRTYCDGKQGVYDKYGKQILPTEYYRVLWEDKPQTYYTFSTPNEYVGNIIPAKKNKGDFWTLYNRNGEKITNTTYRTVMQSWHPDIVKVSRTGNGNFGLVNIDGNTIVPLKYNSDQISLYGSNRAWLYNGNAWDCIDEKGQKVFTQPDWYQASLYSEDLCLIENKANNIGYINLKGEIIIPVIYECAKNENGQNLSARFQNGKARVSDGTRNGWIDKEGNFTPDE